MKIVVYAVLFVAVHITTVVMTAELYGFGYSLITITCSSAIFVFLLATTQPFAVMSLVVLSLLAAWDWDY